MSRLTREQSREITREKLRTSAIKEIAVNGFVGASIDRICESAGFSRGAFYANFANKEDLLLDIMRTSYSREAENWIALLKSENDLEALLPVLRERFTGYLSDKCRIMFMTELQLYAKRNQAFSKHYNQELLATRFKAEQVLEAVYRKAGIKPHRPISFLANMMRGLLAGLVLEYGNHVALEQPADLLIVFLEDMLKSGTPV